jgi:predicted nucleic acid-binding Zn ribbon protein
MEDVFQKFDDKPLKKCPECGKHKLYRVLTGGIHGYVAGSETIGSLADKNTKKYKSQISEAEAKKKEENPEPEKPWYHGDATAKEINKMTERQKVKYIMEGEK